MLFGLFDYWSKSKSFTSYELRALQELLPTSNKLTNILLRQAEQAPYVTRQLISGCSYEARIPFVDSDTLLIKCNRSVVSPRLVIKTPEGHVLLLETEVLRGGFLFGLKGRTQDGGAWPKAWTSDFLGLSIVGDLSVWIAEIATDSFGSNNPVRLFDWLNLSSSQFYDVTVSEIELYAGASLAEIKYCEDRLQLDFTQDFRELLLMSNGITLNPQNVHIILGTYDLEYMDEASKWLCISPFEDRCVVIACDNRIMSQECFLLSSDGKMCKIGSLKDYVRESVTPSRPRL